MSVGGGSGGTMCSQFNHASNNFFSDKQYFLFLAERLKFVTHHKMVVNHMLYAVSLDVIHITRTYYSGELHGSVPIQHKTDKSFVIRSTARFYQY
jgi:hypothetical protein